MKVETPVWNSYNIVWEDFQGAKQRCSFNCKSWADASVVVEELQAISAARVVSVTENGCCMSLEDLETRAEAGQEQVIRSQAELVTSAVNS